MTISWRKNKIHRWIKQFDLRGYLIFLAAVLLSVYAIIITHSYWAWIALGVVCLRILFTQCKLLILVSIICGLGTFLYFGLYFQAEQLANQHSYQGKIEPTILQPLPDTVEIDGNLLSFQGYLYEKIKKPSKVSVVYFLQSEQEKEKWQAAEGNQLLLAQGELVEPEQQRNLNGFDYRKYLQGKGIYRSLSAEKLAPAPRALSTTESWYFGKYLRQLRFSAILYIDKYFPAETALYMKSLLIGVKDKKFQYQMTDFQLLGILHLFSLSGLHLYFFLSFLKYFLLRIGITHETIFWVELSFLFFYFMFTGGTIGMGRAALQAGLLATNRRFHLGFSRLDCWAVNLGVMTIFQPHLLQQAGGQLTYVLTFFLILAHPFLSQIKHPVLQSFAFSSVLSITALPLLWFHFHEWNFLSLLFSFILIYIFRYLLLPAISSCFALSFIWHNLGYSWLGGLLEKSLLGLQGLVTSFANWDWLRFVSGKITFWQLALCFISLIIWWCVLNSHKLKKRHNVFVLFIFSLVCFGKYFSPVGMIAFVDVGQGDAIFIQLPFHQGNFLIDTGGRLSLPEAAWQRRMYKMANAQQTLIPFLKSQGVKKLDKVFITHADADHCGDLAVLAKAIPITTLLFPVGTDQKASFQKVVKQLVNQGTLSQPILAQYNLQDSELQLNMLYPWLAGNGENHDSLVLYLQIKDRSFLLTGDLDELGEEYLIQRYPTLSVDVLKAGHHGSRSSSSDKLLAALQPKQVIVSCGKNNRYGHPHAEVLARFTQLHTEIYRTDQNGMLYYRWFYRQEHLGKIQQLKKAH